MLRQDQPITPEGIGSGKCIKSSAILPSTYKDVQKLHLELIVGLQSRGKVEDPKTVLKEGRWLTFCSLMCLCSGFSFTLKSPRCKKEPHRNFPLP